MSAPPVEIPPMTIYVFYYTWLMGAFIIAGIVALIAYPAHYKKVALFWGITGLAQVILSGLIFYPYSIFAFFPSWVAVGLFTLTCGIVLTAFSILRGQSPRILSLIFLLIGCLEIVAFFDFYFKFPDLSRWNVTIDATPYIAFLVASIVTLGCGILALWKPKL